MVKWMGFWGFLKEKEEGKESLFGLWRSKRKILEAAAMAIGRLETACLELGFINHVGFISLSFMWLHIILGPSNAFVLIDFGPLIDDMDGCMGHNNFKLKMK